MIEALAGVLFVLRLGFARKTVTFGISLLSADPIRLAPLIARNVVFRLMQFRSAIEHYRKQAL